MDQLVSHRWSDSDDHDDHDDHDDDYDDYPDHDDKYGDIKCGYQAVLVTTMFLQTWYFNED